MLNRTIAKYLFYAVAIVLFTWTASLTVSFIQSVLPNAFWAVPYLGLVIFDGGLIAWMFVFLSHAEGAIQRATALILTIINLLGVGLMVIAEILLDGQTLTAPPESLGTMAVWAIGVWTIINVAGVVLFHLGDNEARKEMAIQSEKDAIFEGALKELGKLRTANQAQLAQELSATMFAKLVSDMHADRDADGTPDILQRGRQVGPATVIPLGISTHDAPRQSKPDNGVTKPLGGGAGEGGANSSDVNFQ
jgi:hypothetical protein